MATFRFEHLVELGSLFITDGARNVNTSTSTSGGAQDYLAVTNGFLVDVGDLPELYFLSNIAANISFRIDFEDEASATTLGGISLGDDCVIYRQFRDTATFALDAQELVFLGKVTGITERSGLSESVIEFKIGTDFATSRTSRYRSVADFAAPPAGFQDINWS